MKQLHTLLMTMGLISALGGWSQTTESAATTNPKRELVQRLVISDARKNGRDITPQTLEAGGELLFYRRAGEDKLYLALINSKSASYTDGPIYGLTTATIPETPEDFAQETTSFRWSYTQSDGVAGTAQVSLVRVKKPQGVIYQMVVLNEVLDQWQYKGHVDGTVNLSAIQEKRN